MGTFLVFVAQNRVMSRILIKNVIKSDHIKRFKAIFYIVSIKSKRAIAVGKSH